MPVCPYCDNPILDQVIVCGDCKRILKWWKFIGYSLFFIAFGAFLIIIGSYYITLVSLQEECDIMTSEPSIWLRCLDNYAAPAVGLIIGLLITLGFTYVFGRVIIQNRKAKLKTRETKYP